MVIECFKQKSYTVNIVMFSVIAGVGVTHSHKSLEDKLILTYVTKKTPNFSN